jgi:hypothetical protein
MEALRVERETLGVERDAVERALRDARAAERLIPERSHAAQVAALRGRPCESMTTIADDAERLRGEIAVGEARRRALLEADREIGREMLELIDREPAHYVARADAASVEAVAAGEAAERAISGAAEAWSLAERRWMVVHESAIRRGLAPPAFVPGADFEGVLFAFSRITVGRAPWPGGRQPEEVEAA